MKRANKSRKGGGPEYRDGSHPDSKLALYRILTQKIDHPYAKLLSLQLVPDDIAWALDCRLRYRLDMAEVIPLVRATVVFLNY
jgi:hypothetical protein